MTALSGTVLLTGASGGIGQAIARALHARGAQLVLSGRRTEVLEPLGRELGARVIAADLGRREDVVALAAAAGDVDILIANAALPGSGTFMELQSLQIDTILEVNLRAPIALAHALVPGMLARGRGHVVFISSLSGKAASPAASLYNATKFGLRGFSLGVREDLHASGVSASVVLPGFISEAGMFHDSGVKLPRGVGTKTPEEVADGVVRAIEQDRAEVVVAPLGLRLGTDLAGLAPQFSARMQRRLGGDRVARQMAAAQQGALPGR
ncbi:MAG TPA: SDR family NAD(P)-dependent oxidoreductase [Solirubrobacteraceae bacterium]|nr:SDR family NAD(P)-dependent oxidoreductase [Solirubrobacteraceae bacterium]